MFDTLVDEAPVDPCDAVVPEGVLPELIGVTPPGPELAVLLATVDRSALGDDELVVLARARVRQIAHEQAQLAGDLVAVADRCRPRMSEPIVDGWHLGRGCVDHAVEEIAVGLRWTQAAADRQLDFAEAVVKRLPALYHAMLDGEIDYPKAKACADAVAPLDGATARRVVEQALTRASRQTTGLLRQRLARLVIKADPGAARRRYREGVKSRRLELGREDDGSASLHGRNLPVERTLAAHGRVRAIADWLKDNGDERTIEQLQIDVALDLLQGLPLPGPDGQDWQPSPTDPPATDASGTDAGAAESAATAAALRGAGGGRRGVCPTCGLGRLARGLELTVPVETLLGYAEHPGELGTWGPVLAEAARATVAQLRSAPWRVSATGPDGRVIANVPVRRRPSVAAAALVRARDRTCRFPGCRRPAARAEIDHTKPYSHGGPTIPPNLACLCKRHHALKSAGLWHVFQLDDATLVWRSHLGNTYTTRPVPADSDVDP